MTHAVPLPSESHEKLFCCFPQQWCSQFEYTETSRDGIPQKYDVEHCVDTEHDISISEHGRRIFGRDGDREFTYMKKGSLLENNTSICYPVTLSLPRLGLPQCFHKTWQQSNHYNLYYEGQSRQSSKWSSKPLKIESWTYETSIEMDRFISPLFSVPQCILHKFVMNRYKTKKSSIKQKQTFIPQSQFFTSPSFVRQKLQRFKKVSCRQN
jgi:hypothetical protein